MRLSLQNIHHDQAGFEALVSLQAQTNGCLFEVVDIDMTATSWFDADMCAPLGAILYSMGENVNTVRLENIRPDVERILSKNGFLSHYGRNKIPDQWGTTIPYNRFEWRPDSNCV